MISVNAQPAPSAHVVNPHGTMQSMEEPLGVLTRSQRAALGLSLPDGMPSTSEVKPSNTNIKVQPSETYLISYPTTPLTDYSSPRLTVNILGKQFSRVIVDGGFGINLMPNFTMLALGLQPTRPAPFTVTLADQRIVYPLGNVDKVPVQVQDFTFSLDFVVVRLPQVEGGFPLLIGRPWLRHTKALHDWGNDAMWIHTLDSSMKPIRLGGGMDPAMQHSSLSVESTTKSDQSTPPEGSSDEDLLEWLAATQSMPCYGVSIQLLSDDIPSTPSNSTNTPLITISPEQTSLILFTRATLFSIYLKQEQHNRDLPNKQHSAVSSWSFEVRPVFWEWVIQGDTKLFVSYLSWFKNLVKLTLSALPLGKQSKDGILPSFQLGCLLQSLPMLQLLDASDADINAEAAVSLSIGLKKHKSLQILRLASNNIATVGFSALVQAVPFVKTLKVLDVRENGISAWVEWSVVEALQDAALEELILEGNFKFIHKSVLLSSTSSTNNSLDELIEAAEASDIAASMKDLVMRGLPMSLKLLQYAKCELDDIRTMVLVKSLALLSQIQKLDLSGNKISSEGANSVFLWLQENVTLRELNLSNNYITDSCSATLCRVLRNHSSLEKLSLMENYSYGESNLHEVLNAAMERGVMLQPKNFTCLIPEVKYRQLFSCYNTAEVKYRGLEGPLKATSCVSAGPSYSKFCLITTCVLERTSSSHWNEECRTEMRNRNRKSGKQLVLSWNGCGI
ncbi:hypothetical protein L7F22_067282 [Adiantum nelumboides]|nr:hypothetical protein [Adiantum nelumboides]